MKLIGCTTRYALAAIARPHLKLYAGGNDATALNKAIGVFSH